MADPRPGDPDIDALAMIVRTESHRVLSGAAIDADPARVAAGWQRRFIADGHRVAEAVALYESLGFDAVADPVHVESMDPDCADCRILIQLEFKTIYTRKREDPQP
jgi:hypothetical protein